MFGNNPAKQEQKVQMMLQRYGLQGLSDPRDIQAVRNIATSLSGNKLIEVGTLLQGNGVDPAKLSYLNAIMEQNFIIIRQLDKLTKLLEK